MRLSELTLPDGNRTLLVRDLTIAILNPLGRNALESVRMQRVEAGGRRGVGLSGGPIRPWMVMNIVEFELADECDLFRRVKGKSTFWKGVFIPGAL